jgi:hypothetical protein
MTGLLGGADSPIGWSVQYLDTPHGAALDAVVAAREDWGSTFTVRSARAFPLSAHDAPAFRGSVDS